MTIEDCELDRLAGLVEAADAEWGPGVAMIPVPSETLLALIKTARIASEAYKRGYRAGVEGTFPTVREGAGEGES